MSSPSNNIEPTPDVPLLDGLSDVVITPVSLRKIFLLLTRLHYSSPSNYGEMESRMSNYVWSQDKAKRTLLIDYDSDNNPKNTDLRPAIFIGCSDVVFEKRVIDNQKSQTRDRSGEEYAKTAGVSIVVRHVGSSPDEALSLSELSSQFFLGLRKLMIERVRLRSYEISRLTSPKAFKRNPDEALQEYVSDLLIDIQFNSIWLVLRESHRIKTIGYAQSLKEFSTIAEEAKDAD